LNEAAPQGKQFTLEQLCRALGLIACLERIVVALLN
jgi:hypothetical protein